MIASNMPSWLGGTDRLATNALTALPCSGATNDAFAQGLRMRVNGTGGPGVRIGPSLSAAEALESAGALENAEAARRMDSIRQAFAGLVSAALLAPAMAMLHESSFRDGPLAPGDAERRFAPMLHQHLADRIIGAAHLPVLDAMTRRYAAAAGLETAPDRAGGDDRSMTSNPDAAREVVHARA